MFTIRTGDWRSLWVREQCILVELRTCSMTETLRGLYSLGYLWLDRTWTDRARLAFPEGTTFHIGGQFIVGIEEILNGLGRLGDARDPDAVFAFYEPSDGGTSSKYWRQDRDYYNSLEVEESKGALVALMCGIARAFMHRDAIYRLTFDRAHPRCLGRVLKWCQMHLGETYYITERDNTATRRQREVREMVDTRERPVRDRQMRPYDPRYAPPPPRRGRAQAQAQQQAPPQVPPQVPPQAPTQAPPQAPTQEGQEQEAPTVDVSIGSEIPMTERGGTSAGVRRSARLQHSPPADTKGKGKKSKLYLTCGISHALPQMRCTLN